MITLSDLRDQLLDLHKALLDYQKHVYESTVGPIENPQVYYNLVLGDPSFAWLRTLSALVVSIDELLEAKDGVTDEKTKQIATYTKGILTATGSAGSFEQNYTATIQKDPVIALLHGKLIQEL